MSLLAYSTSTPEKQSKPFGECKIPSSIPSLKFDSYEENWNQKEKTKEPDVKEIKAKVLKKKMQDLSVVGYSSDGSLSVSGSLTRLFFPLLLLRLHFLVLTNDSSVFSSKCRNQSICLVRRK